MSEPYTHLPGTHNINIQPQQQQQPPPQQQLLVRDLKPVVSVVTTFGLVGYGLYLLATQSSTVSKLRGTSALLMGVSGCCQLLRHYSGENTLIGRSASWIGNLSGYASLGLFTASAGIQVIENMNTSNFPTS